MDQQLKPLGPQPPNQGGLPKGISKGLGKASYSGLWQPGKGEPKGKGKHQPGKGHGKYFDEFHHSRTSTMEVLRLHQDPRYELLLWKKKMLCKKALTEDWWILQGDSSSKGSEL